MSKSYRYANGTFMAFGIAIGYASSYVPEQTLWVLAVGLTACAIAYLAVALRSHDRSIWWVYGMQTLILAIAAITPLTSKPLSGIWILVFLILGCIGVMLDISTKR